MVKGRTCRTFNVTRKIYIRDIEPIIRASLDMTQFSIGTAVFHQIRGSPMGSPLSPALCLMVVALSEEVWFRTFESYTCPTWISPPDAFDTLTTACSLPDPIPGLWILPLTCSCTRTSTASPSSWKPNLTRNSSASFWILTHSRYVIHLLEA